METLDRIARSGDAVFAIDSADRIVLWNRRCEELLGRPARAVLGKRCYDVIGGRDAQGNVYCYRNCPVVYQAREKPQDPVRPFPLSVEVAGERKLLNVSLFAMPAHHPSLATVVHVLREEGKSSPLEKKLAMEERTDAPLWPMTQTRPETFDLTLREKEILHCLSRGLSTAAISRKLRIRPVTVRNHVQNLLGKLGVHSKLSAVVFAYQKGLI